MPVSTFDDQFSAYGAPPEIAYFGERATYKPSSALPAASITMRGIVGDETITEAHRNDGRWEVRHRTFEFRTDPTATEGGVADPRTTDTVVLTDSGGEEWAVESIAGNADGMTAVMLYRERKLETTHPGSRHLSPAGGR